METIKEKTTTDANVDAAKKKILSVKLSIQVMSNALQKLSTDIAMVEGELDGGYYAPVELRSEDTLPVTCFECGNSGLVGKHSNSWYPLCEHVKLAKLNGEKFSLIMCETKKYGIQKLNIHRGKYVWCPVEVPGLKEQLEINKEEKK